MALATYQDLENRLQQSFSTAEQTAAESFIVDATAIIETFLGYNPESDDDITENVFGDG